MIESQPPKIFIAGHQGMVGSALVRALRSKNAGTLILRTRAELDLENQGAVNTFIANEKPDLIYMAAARVGGIHANNTYPADFIYSNLVIQANIIHAAHCNDVQQLLFLGSSCIYPRQVTQPMSEDALLTGKLELTNEPYAIAKIAGIKLCESYNRQYGRDYRSVMPTNLYGSGDNYHPENSHVIPGLLRRFHEAKFQREPTVVVWGTGDAKREFLHVDDMASACLHVMELSEHTYASCVQPQQSHINIGSGVDISIAELAHTISEVVGYEGKIVFDVSKPDGALRKLMDSSRLRSLGWKNRISLREGLVLAYRDFQQAADFRSRI